MTDGCDWAAVADFIESAAASCAPEVGSPEWCALDDADPRKAAALVRSSTHDVIADALDVSAAEKCAACVVSSSINWAEVASALRQRTEAIASGAYIPRRRSA